MKFGVVTLFPELIEHAAQWGVTGRARARGQWALHCFSPRAYAKPPHFAVDDRPFGGGPGMVMLHEPLTDAIAAARSAILADMAPHDMENSAKTAAPRVPTVLLSPAGRRFTQSDARKFRGLPGMVLVCGRYEGIDARTLDMNIDEELSIGDFVLSGGEFAALSVMDAVVRLLPGVLGDPQSGIEESFSFGLLDHPHFTRPETLPDGTSVPAVLMSGDHKKIRTWRREQSLTITAEKRPDLLATARGLSAEDLEFLRKIGYTGELTQSKE